MTSQAARRRTGSSIDASPYQRKDFSQYLQPRSDMCVSVLAEDFYGNSQATSPQISATGITSFMNCLGLGHPFLTYNFHANRQFLKRHNLKLDHIYTVSSPEREILHDAIKQFGSQLKDIPVCAGGVIFNIARMMQWLLPQPRAVVILGARAMDKDANALDEMCRDTRLGIRLEEKERCLTSALLVLHMKTRYCEIYFSDNLAYVSTVYIDKPIVTKVLERANIIFTSDLSIQLMPNMNHKVAYYAFSRFKHFLVVIHHSESLVNAKDSLCKILTYVDIVFLSPQSAKKFIEIFNVPCYSCCRHAWDIYLWLKSFSKKCCTVIVSDGLKKAYVHTDLSNGKSAKYKSKIPKNYKIVDYYGVSSAFVGGFLAMMIRGFHIDACVECGFFCASLVVGTFGMTLPEARDEVLLNWYSKLDYLMVMKSSISVVKRRDSDLPFTVFQTPWKETDVINVFSESTENSRRDL